VSASAPASGGQPPEDRRPTRERPTTRPRQVYRRRRAGAGLALIGLLALLIALIVPGGHGSRARASGRSRSAYRSGDLPGQPDAARGARKEPDQRTEEQAIDRILSYTPAVLEGANKGHEVALTFDDGPGPYTSQLVAKLDALHVHATFFAIGEMERWFSDGTRAELRSGDVVEDHTETHAMLGLMSAEEQHSELLDQMARIELLGGPRPRLFRPPYGSYDATTLQEVRALHLLMILWSTDTQDYTLPGVQAIVQRVLAGAHAGAIILLHDAGGNRSETIAALPAIVKGLHHRGLHPVTVPQLLVDDPPPRGQHIPENLSE
jgi:peptidoglycan/xylan/chitin deacetylase (PgdA/CDA1 family)